ncbi:MAG: GMC family oxidoreductase [Janthinobacterium lividum]
MSSETVKPIDYRQSELGENALGRLRSSMRRHDLEDVVDAVVIGTGAGGSPLLAKLAAAGRKVVALEAGQWFTDPARQFPTDELSAGQIYWNNERLSAGDTPQVHGGNNSGTGVGGSTLHWGAFCPRADERDLKLKTDSGGKGIDWPLDLRDLVPFYEEVERFLGVSGPSPYPWDPARRYPTGPVPINGPGQLMLRGFEKLGLRASAAPIAALSEDYFQPEYGTRKACVHRGFCHQGCRNGAKASMDVTYLPWAVRSGAEIRPHCFVTGFEQDAAGRLTAVIYRDSSDPDKVVVRRQKTKNVFLCAGAIETPRLLLYTGLGNASGQVGKNYMGHVSPQVWGTFDEPVRMNKGFPATVISEDLMRPKDADFAGGYLVQSLGVVPVTWATNVARGRRIFGADLTKYLADYNFIAGIGGNGETLPTEKNHLALSDELDTNGIPKPIIHFSYHENEERLEKHSIKVMEDAWKAAGARDTWVLRRTAHCIGTCRMGVDPEASVVDPFGRSHEIPNLWISDNSTFPSSLAANPALTIMTLALRTAEAFLKG